MKIESLDKTSFIEIKVIPQNLENDFETRITIAAKNFAGNNDEIWFDKLEFETFLNKLHNFDSNTDTLVLNSMSPNEFSFKIFRADNLGHIGIESTISKGLYLNDKYFENSCKVFFEFELSKINDLLNDFKKEFL